MSSHLLCPCTPCLRTQASIKQLATSQWTPSPNISSGCLRPRSISSDPWWSLWLVQIILFSFFHLFSWGNIGFKRSNIKKLRRGTLFRTTGDVALWWPWLFLAIGALCWEWALRLAPMVQWWGAWGSGPSGVWKWHAHPSNSSCHPGKWDGLMSLQANLGILFGMKPTGYRQLATTSPSGPSPSSTLLGTQAKWQKRLLGAARGSRRCWLALHDEAVRKKSSLFGKFWQDWQAAHKSAMVRVSDVSGSQYKTWQVWCWLQLLTNTAWPVVIKWDQQCIRYKSLGDWGVIPVLPTHTGITRTYYDYNPSKSIMRNFRSTGHSIHWAQVNIPTEILLLGTTPQNEELFFFTAGWPGVPGNSDKDLWVWIHPPNRLVM